MKFNGIIFKIIYKAQNISKVLNLEIRNTNATDRGGGEGGGEKSSYTF